MPDPKIRSDRGFNAVRLLIREVLSFANTDKSLSKKQRQRLISLAYKAEASVVRELKKESHA